MSVVRDAVRDLHPAYFAMVMATGIVSIAAELRGWELIAEALFWINAAAFVVLWLMTLARILWYPRHLFNDLFDHSKGVGFFTTIAGTCVMGSQLILLFENYLVATFLWYLGILLYACLMYTIFAGFTVKADKPSIAEGINGGWLIAVVATQLVSILGVRLVPQFEFYRQEVLFFSLLMWLFGGMLYIWIISLIFYRYTFFKFHPSDFVPSYWINMGAVAVSTLGGTLLIENAPESPLLQETLPFLKGLTLLFWATGTWWIPMLVVLGIWRYVYKRFPLTYDPLYWGAVFPLGMYTVCTIQLSRDIDLHFLDVIPTYFSYIALLAWTLTFLGLLRSILGHGKDLSSRRWS